MFRAKPKSNAAFPRNLIGYTAGFLTLNDLPNIARVSKEWSSTAKSWSSNESTQLVIKNMVLNTLKTQQINVDESKYETEANLKNKKIDWKLFYIKFQEYRKNQGEHKAIISIQNDFERMREANDYAARTGGEVAYGVTRADTCAAGCGGCVLCGLGAYLVTFFACKEMACVFSCFYSIVGFNIGFITRSRQLEVRAQTYQANGVNQPLLEDVAGVNPASRSHDQEHESDDEANPSAEKKADNRPGIR